MSRNAEPKCETRWPGLISSVADGSTYCAPVVETGSSFHSARSANATSSPLSWVISLVIALRAARGMAMRGRTGRSNGPFDHVVLGFGLGQMRCPHSIPVIAPGQSLSGGRGQWVSAAPRLSITPSWVRMIVPSG